MPHPKLSHTQWRLLMALVDHGGTMTIDEAADHLFRLAYSMPQSARRRHVRATVKSLQAAGCATLTGEVISLTAAGRTEYTGV